MYSWHCDGVPAQELEEAGLAPTFQNQQMAEDWLSAFFSDLQEVGVSQVTLMEGECLVYGPMSLET